MSAHFERLMLDARGAAAHALLPGLVQRVLGQAAGVRADEVGLVEPLGRGRVAVEIAATRAAHLATPRALPFSVPDGAVTWFLRRDDDPPDPGRATLRATWTGDAEVTPGALAAALSGACASAVGAEELGAVFRGRGWLVFDVPLDVVTRLELPWSASVGDVALTVDLDGDGKKKP